MKQILRMTGLIRPLLLMLALLLFGNARGWAETYSLTPDSKSTGSSYTTYITSLTEFTYEEVSWMMNQWNPSTLQVKTNQANAANEFRFYNTSAFAGKITKVVVTFSAFSVSDASKLMFLGGTSAVTATTGGSAGTWNATAKTLTWTPGENDNFTYFAFYQNGKAASGTNYLAEADAIVVTYETSGSQPSTLEESDLALTGAPVALSFDLYNNSDDQVISYTTSSTGAVTISGGTGYVTTSVDATNKTITVTPTAVTPSAQTITISQEADETYAAGSATFTVSVDDSTPTPTHTATFSVNGQTTMQDFEEGAAITFPANPADVDDKTFWGWTSEAINGTIDEAPTKVTSATMGESDVTYYAVFATKTEGTSTTVTDVLDNAFTGISGTTYADWSGKSDNSDAIYAGNSAGGDKDNPSIQLRSNNSNSGIITTTSGGTAAKVTIHWHASSTTSRVVSIYGKNTAFSSPADLYNSSKQGTLLGEFTYSEMNQVDELTITGNYKYIGIRSKSGALYLSSVSIDWASATPDTYSAFCTTVAADTRTATTVTINANGITNANVFEGTAAGQLAATVMAGEEAVNGATIVWSGNNDAVATIANDGTVTLVGAGAVTFTATYEGDNTYKGSSATYDLKVTNVDPNANDGSETKPYTVAEAIAATPASGTSDNVYIKGIVSEFRASDIMSDGTNYRYYISDDGTTTNQLLVYKGKGLNDAAFSSADDLLIGDEVVILGGLTTFNNAPEVAANNYIVSLKRTVTCATPTFTPEAGAVVSGTGIGINCATEGATIYYTTDGSTPTTSSNVYSATFAITIDQDMTIKAIAVKEGCVNSEVAEASYTIARPCATPTFSVAGGTFTTATTIDFRCDTEGATIYYSFNGEDWYEGASYVVTSSTTLYIKATKAGMVDSEVASASFTMRIPTITLNSKAVRVTAAGDDGTIAVTYDNITEVVAEVKFYEADGSTEATYDWLEAEIDNNNNVTYIIDANTSNDERKAYMKVYALDDTSGDVYSELITITQAGYVVDYAALPFEFDGGKGNLPTGLTQSGLGSDYSASPCLRFDTTGDNLILKLNEAPGTLTFDIKGNSFSGGTFKVQTSADGETYADLESYTELGDTQSEEFDNLSDNVRYIKWIYTTKSSGNVALGNIKVAKASTEPTITLSATSIEATFAEADGTITVTCENMGDAPELDIIFCDAQGTEATYNWIDAEINDENNVYYIISANESTEARTAYMKVYAISNNDEAYSSLITITQAGKVIDYATLPFSYDGNGQGNLPFGLTASGIGTYNSSPKMKFDGTDDVLVLKTEGGAAVLSFDIKGNSFSGGTFTVQTSIDGTEYTDLNTYNELDATTTERFNLGADVHYIKWIYTEKVTGNVALGNIKVNKPEAVTVTAAGYATYCSENALSFEGTGIKAYVGTLNGTELTFTPITEAPANTGLLLVADGGKTANAAIITEAAAVTNNCLTGVTTETTLSSEDYILNVKEAGAGFYKAGNYTTLGANRAYIAAQQGGQVKGFVINLNGDLPTGVAQMDGEKLNADDAAIFNLNGQRISKPQKGVNIVNGKKVLVK